MNEQQEQMMQQIVALVQAAMQGDQEAQNQIAKIMQAAEQGNPEAQKLAVAIQQIMQQAQGEDVALARKGAKLNYLRKLNKTCPPGYEIERYASGGNVKHRCKKCEEKKQERQKSNNIIDEFKCGRKIKKNQEGDSFGKQGNQMLAEARPHEMVGTKQFKERQQVEEERKRRKSITYNEKDHKALTKKYQNDGYSYKNFTPEEKTKLGAYNEHTVKN